MKRIGIAALAMLATPAYADGVDDPLGRCMTSNTRDADRIVLARWLIATLSADKAVADMTRVTPRDRRALNEQFAAIAQDMFTVRCRNEAVAALRADGQSAFDESFGTLIQAAMQERVGAMVVPQAEQIGRGMDRDSVAAVFKEAGLQPPPEAKTPGSP